MSRKRVIISLIGTVLDRGEAEARWERWRPTVSLFQHDDLAIDRLELLHPRQAHHLAKVLAKDIEQVSPQTTVRPHLVDPRDPWDFEEVYTALLDFASAYPFDLEREEYLVHITTGTHVAQICLFLLTESRRFPATLIQTAPKQRTNDPAGTYRIIDLDLSKYNRIAARFQREFKDNIAGLKSGIPTRNARFNRLIEQLEHVAAHATDPILLTGPTGAGKSHLARRIYELKKHRRQIEGPFVEVNCATLRGDSAMSALFGHKKGAFTGATADRAGLLRAADGGLLFLDEIGELGLDEQAMLLRAVEEKRFLPIGADTETTSNFQLIAGTNRVLAQHVRDGLFRDDLLARIDLWAFDLPSLRDRTEDIEPNLDFELTRFAERTGRAIHFATEARDAFLRFATAPDALWRGNFRDLSAAVIRMGTLSAGGRITTDVVEYEITRLRHAWSPTVADGQTRLDLCTEILGHEAAANLDRFDRVQLNDVLLACRQSDTLSDAGRALFAQSRERRTSINDSDRLRKYLARFDLTWEQIGRSKHLNR